MSVDKFGRYSEIGVKSSFYDKDCGLPLTSEGDYNIGNKRLRFVKNPEDSGDAINLITLESKTTNALKLEGNAYSAKNQRISNIANPKDSSDAINLITLESKTSNALKLEGDVYNANNQRISNIANPKDGSDAINLITLQSNTSNTLKLEGNVYNAKNRRISNIANPKNDQDSVTKGYLDQIVPRKLDNRFSFYNFIIHDIGEPIDEFDAVNLKYIKTNCITYEENQKWWDAKGQRIANLPLGIDKHDCAIIDQVPKSDGKMWDFGNRRLTNVFGAIGDNDCVINKQTIILNSTLNGFDGKNRRLSNIADPKQLNDVVNVNFFNKNCITYNEKLDLNKLEEKWWDANGHRIGNLSAGIHKHDCVILDQVPKTDGRKWNFKHRRVSNVAAGFENHDCVTMEQTITYNGEVRGFDGKHIRISNIDDPEQLNDVVNVNFIVRVLSNMFFDFYNDLSENKINLTEKDNWIRFNIVDKYFIHPKTKLLRTNYNDD